MDTTKTGALIRELRKERNMTQKDLADQLHLTDRAVSKWERGLCAPDISTLEPLAVILQVTVTELIAGERMPEKEYIMEIEKNVQNTIDYSEQEISNNKKQHRKKIRITICACILFCIGLTFFLAWRNGYFYIVDRSISPDQSTELIVYGRLISKYSDFEFFPKKPHAIVENGNYVCLFPGEYQNIYWAPDSQKHIVAIKQDGKTLLYLYEYGVQISPGELCDHVSRNFHFQEPQKLGFTTETYLHPTVKANYDFIQWSSDSRSILMSYSYYDAYGTHYQGCVWYDYINDVILDSLDLPPKKASTS